MIIPPEATVTYFDVTGQSRAIIGETVSINTDGGFFLIEVLSAFRRQGSYIDNRESRPQITAVVSSQYDSNNSITGYSDSGVPFVHHGASYIISDCTVRILNPLTKQPATNLGENNCIWIQVDKAPQAQQLKQPQPQELHTGVQNLAMGVQTDERTRQVEKEQLLHNQLKRTEGLKAPGVTELAEQGVQRLEQRATLVEPQQSTAKGRAILTPGQRSELLQAMIARKAKAEDDAFAGMPSGADLPTPAPLYSDTPAPKYIQPPGYSVNQPSRLITTAEGKRQFILRPKPPSYDVEVRRALVNEALAKTAAETGRLPPAPAAAAPEPPAPAAAAPEPPAAAAKPKKLKFGKKKPVNPPAAAAAEPPTAKTAAKTKIERNEQGQLKFTGPALKYPPAAPAAQEPSKPA
jgi:hypothetical protein